MRRTVTASVRRTYTATATCCSWQAGRQGMRTGVTAICRKMRAAFACAYVYAGHALQSCNHTLAGCRAQPRSPLSKAPPVSAAFDKSRVLSLLLALSTAVCTLRSMHAGRDLHMKQASCQLLVIQLSALGQPIAWTPPISFPWQRYASDCTHLRLDR